MNSGTTFSSGEEYVAFVEKYCSLLNEQLLIYEERVKNPSRISSVVNQLPPLIALVETVGYLRGQDGLFLYLRPSTNEQKRFYSLEAEFEARLQKLIQTVLRSDFKDDYLQQLQAHFEYARTVRDPK